MAVEWAAWVEWAAAISIWIEIAVRSSTRLTNGLASKEAGLFRVVHDISFHSSKKKHTRTNSRGP